MVRHNVSRYSFAKHAPSGDETGGGVSARDHDGQSRSDRDPIVLVAADYSNSGLIPETIQVATLIAELKTERRLYRAEIVALKREKEQLTKSYNALRWRVVLHMPVWVFTGTALVRFDSAVGSGNWVGGVAWACAIVIGLLCIGKLFFWRRDNT